MIEIDAFVTVARTGTFTAAAGALRVSQPAVSRRIELLEQELGAPLFERLHAGARLTAAGEAFLPYARQIMAATRDGAAAVQNLAQGETGEISLAIVGTLASTNLTARLRAFRETQTGIRLRLRTALSSEVSELVQLGEVTFGLRYFPDPSGSLVSTHVEDEDLVVVCAGHSELVGRAPACSAALANLPWITFPTGAGSSGEPFAKEIVRKLDSAGLGNAEIVTIDSLTAQKRLIEADFGIGLLPASSITEEVRLGTLHVLTMPELETTVPVVAIHRHEGYLSPAARRLLTMLIEPDARGPAALNQSESSATE